MLKYNYLLYFTQQSTEEIYFFWRGCVKPPDNYGGNNMGIFDSFSKVFNQGRERDEAYRKPNNLPVKLVEPSVGRVVTLQVTEQNDFFAKLYMDQLKTYAESLEQFGVQWEDTDKTIRITFANGDMAENARKTWKR